MKKHLPRFKHKVLKDDKNKELTKIEAILDDLDALSPENIKATAMDAIHRPFMTIRGCAKEDPQRAGLIADAFHNLPKAVDSWSHQDCRKETVRAIHALNAGY